MPFLPWYRGVLISRANRQLNGAPSRVNARRIQKGVMIGKLRNAMQKLEPEESMIIDLLYYKGMSQRSAAEKIGIASTTLQYRLKVLMKKLRNLINADAK